MSISKTLFNQQCFDFVRKCQAGCDNWYITINGAGGPVKLSTQSHEELDVTEEQDIMLVKDEIRHDKSTHELRCYEYNIIYSPAFGTPVMYFNVSNQNGSPIEPSDALASLSKADLQEVVNQVEHPYLFRPFFMIHPCRTKDFMDPHCDKEGAVGHVSYLITWLSTVGTLLGLQLDPKLGLASSNTVSQ